MPVVLDASMALAWLFGETGSAEAIIRDADRRGIVVPAIWGLEVANGIAMAVRRKRIPSIQRQVLLKLLAGLDVEIDPPLALADLVELDVLAERHNLTSYDATYLLLALKRRADLASLDNDLRTAAAAEGLTVLPA